MPTTGNRGRPASARFELYGEGDPNKVAANALSQAGGYRSYGNLQPAIKKGLDTARNRPENPYDLGIGNQVRAQYEQALAQLNAAPSLVDSQAAAAMGANREAMAQGAGMRNAQAIQAQRAGANQLSQVAADSGNARLAEFMRQKAQYGAGLSSMRGQDLKQMSAFNEAGLKGRGQNDALSTFYNDLKAKEELRGDEQALKEYMTRQRLAQGFTDSANSTAKDVMQGIGTLFSVLK